MTWVQAKNLLDANVGFVVELTPQFLVRWLRVSEENHLDPCQGITQIR